MSKQGSSQDSSVLKLFDALMKRVSESSKVSSEEGTLLDISLTAAKNFFERQAAGGLSLILFNETADDFIAIKDEPLELTLDVDLAHALRGDRVDFFVEDKKIGNAPIGPEHKARVKFVSRKVGCWPLSCKIVRKNGKEVSDAHAKKGVILQVLDKKPVVCVDASLINFKKSKINVQLAAFLSDELADEFDIVYIDFGDKDRVEEIRKIRHQRSLPMGAIIPLAARIRQFESFDVDFKQSFLTLAVNRLRAQGAPVVALITNLKIDRDYSFPDIKIFKEGSLFSDRDSALLKRLAKNFVTKRKHLQQKDMSAIEWRMNEMVPGQWFNNNRCKVQLNNKLARQEIFKVIDAAEKRIDLQFYIFKESRFAHELGVRLAKAISRGVQVRLMVDALWSGENFLGSWNNFLKRMGKSKQIHILAADSVTLADEWGMTSLRQRDHRKLIIIDGITAFVGGRNGADEYYYDWSEVPIADWTTAENIPWLDAHVQLEGPAVKEVQDLFNNTWKRNGGKHFAPIQKKRTVVKNPIDKDPADRKSRVRLIVHEGTKDANGLAAYESLICGAKNKLILVNDFPVLDDIAEMLIQAVHRGVKVTFLTGNVLARRADGTFFEGGRHRELFEYVVKSRLGVLVDAGVNVYEFQTKALENIAVTGGKLRPYVHAKLITADSRYVSIGSANLDITASYWEREANVFIDDARVVKSLDKQLASMVKQGIKLDTSSSAWKKEAPQREIVARLWPDSFLN